MNGQIDDEDAIRERYSQRIEEMRRSKAKQMQFRANIKKYGPPAAAVCIVLILILVRVTVFHTASGKQNITEKTQQVENESVSSKNARKEAQNINQIGQQIPEEENDALPALSLLPSPSSISGPKRQKEYRAEAGNDTDVIGDEDFFSQYGIFIDLKKEKVLAGKGAFEVINPASMTKILTVLVAAEHVDDLDDTFTITLEITDYGYVNDCSSAGFEKDETVSIRDLFYGTVLPSGADAAVALAVYVAGDQDAFVKMMNDKAKELGLSKTAHFTNCVGIYDEEHHCSVYDMAMILEAALDNELCREVLSTKTYTTSQIEQHPEGIILSNWFLRRIEDKDCGGEVISGKTGYVVQSGNCAASYGESKDGEGFICVTAGANSPWRCIADHALLYKRYLPEAS